MPSIAVLGSINMDLVVRVVRFPKAGETIQAEALQQFPGGKGANQAVGSARLGVVTALYAKVGADPFGQQLLRSLQQDKVLTQEIIVQSDVPTGVAIIWVDRQGENMIVISPGANGQVDQAYVDYVLPKIVQADVLLLQLEIPIGTIAYLLERLPSERPFVILDPAPVRDLSSLALERVDLLTPNLIELELLAQKSVWGGSAGGTRSIDEKVLQKVMALLAGRTRVRGLICKAGEQGAYLFRAGRFRHFSAYPVNVVDTTAAGDAFNAGLAVAFAEGRSLEEAIRFANAAGALAVTKEGAQPSLPRREEVEAFLKQQAA